MMHSRVVILSVIFLAVLFSSATYGQSQNITAAELKRMIDRKTKMVIVDARPEQEYKAGHIPKAINIPSDKLRLMDRLLPKDKKIPVVFYCRGGL